MSKKIKLGYALEQEGYRTGQEISIQPSHLLVTGLSQKAGKTTTLKMAKLNRRNYLGIEISEKYLEIAKRRCSVVQEVVTN